ncbi:GyrI-like domain-containing protein [Amycolatopsis sp. NPDC051061]|uniref:GyrI-like domain-containing protein n=1 Tax=Amycolatopsis sp. NPDC051061 TaxID=3155042 RepID=UPI0034252529
MPYDVKKDLKQLYAPKNTDWALLDVPEQQFLAIDGRGNPNTADSYQNAVQALYAFAYTIKMTAKRTGEDFVVGPLEGLWWAADYAAFTVRAKDSWQWTMLISLPGTIGEDAVEEARESVKRKKKIDAPVRLEKLHEGRCAQALHIGSYDDEGPILARLHDEFLVQHGLEPAGLHHEVYLGDPRKTEPAKLKTVLRQPVG